MMRLKKHADQEEVNSYVDAKKNKIPQDDERSQSRLRNERKFLDVRRFRYQSVAMTRFVNRQAKIWIKVFPDKPLTKKPLQTRMGKGKSGVEEWVMNIKPGRIIFEMTGVSEEVAKEALMLSIHKLPFKTKIVSRESENEIY